MQWVHAVLWSLYPYKNKIVYFNNWIVLSIYFFRVLELTTYKVKLCRCFTSKRYSKSIATQTQLCNIFVRSFRVTKWSYRSIIDQSPCLKQLQKIILKRILRRCFNCNLLVIVYLKCVLCTDLLDTLAFIMRLNVW